MGMVLGRASDYPVFAREEHGVRVLVLAVYNGAGHSHTITQAGILTVWASHAGPSGKLAHICGGAERTMSTLSDVWAHETPCEQGMGGGPPVSQVRASNSREFHGFVLAHYARLKAEGSSSAAERGGRKDMRRLPGSEGHTLPG